MLPPGRRRRPEPAGVRSARAGRGLAQSGTPHARVPPYTRPWTPTTPSTSPRSPPPTCRRSWAATWTAAGPTGSATACTTRAAAGTSTSPTGSPSPPSATRTRASRPRSTPRSTGSSGPVHAIGFAESTVRLARMLADTFPDPLDAVLFLNSGSRGDRRRAQARPARDRAARRSSRSGAPSTAGPSARRASRARTSTTGGATSRSCRASTSSPSRPRTATSATTRPRRREACLAPPRDLLATTIAPVAGRRDPHRARPGRGRLLPGAARVPAGRCAPSATSTASCWSPTRSSRASGGPARCGRSSTPGIVPDVVCVAKAIANGLPALRDRHQPGAPGALGPRRPRHDLRRQPGRLRRRRGRPRDDPRRGPRRRTPGCAARSCRAACAS